jgi:tRNA pseudouridine55 synthase
VVVDKPAGWTSHDVVARMRRLLGERRIGHAGTLDPAATGVLPIAVGDATKVVEYLSDASKTYLAEITFGVETDSYDIDGRVTAQRDITRLNEAMISDSVAGLVGEQTQIPPMHSALKVAGRRLYELARQGIEIERQPRNVTITQASLVQWQSPSATILIDCSKGTYVRSIANDLGNSLGTGAYLSNLVRLRTGPFHLCEAWTMLQLSEVDAEMEWSSIAIHPDEVTSDKPALLLDESASIAWRNGGFLKADFTGESIVRAYDSDGRWLGIGRFDVDRGVWRPVKVVGIAA